MKNLFIAIMFSLLFSLPASAAELLMIHSPTCVFCKSFMNDTKPGYFLSEQAKKYPLHVIDISISENREWIRKAIRSKKIKPIIGTPTFILYDDGKEIGRFVGYGGKEWFYHYLDEAIKRSVQGVE